MCIRDSYKRYASSSADCQACPQASECPARSRLSAPHQHFVMRSMDQDLFEEVQARMREPTFGEKLSERMWKMEGLFAEAKQNHCLSRAKYRGRSKLQIQAYLSAMVQNLKRLVCVIYLWVLARWLSHQSQATYIPASSENPQTFSTGPTQFRHRSGVSDRARSGSPHAA